MELYSSRSTINAPLALLMAASAHQELRLLRTWLLIVRLLDPHGTGRLRRHDAVAGLRSLGIGKSAANDWINALTGSRYARLGRETRTGDPYVVLTSIAALLGSYSVSDQGRGVEIPVKPLVTSRAIKALLTLAAAIGFSGPVSRDTRADVLNVSPSTQRRAERAHGATVVPHYAEWDRAARHNRDTFPTLDSTRAFPCGARIYERLPNVVQPPFRVVQRSRHRPSATQTTVESPVTRPHRQHFGSERAARERIRGRGRLPGDGYGYVNPEDRRVFVHIGPDLHHRFGRQARLSRVFPEGNVEASTK